MLDSFRSWFAGLGSKLEAVWQAVTNLPQLILDGLKSIFIPDAEYIQSSFNGFLDELKMKFNIDTGAFQGLFDGSQAVEDVYVDYNISGVGAFNLKVLDTKFFVDGVTYFRPFIRGFIVLMMLLYHVKQVIGFFGYDSGVVTGRTEHIKSAKESQR